MTKSVKRSVLLFIPLLRIDRDIYNFFIDIDIFMYKILYLFIYIYLHVFLARCFVVVIRLPIFLVISSQYARTVIKDEMICCTHQDEKPDHKISRV